MNKSTISNRFAKAHPLPIVVALVKRIVDTVPHYLLIQRNSDPYRGYWALVGGKWDAGETLVDAILREVREETALDATFIALRGTVSEQMLAPDTNVVNAHFLLFVCALFAPDGTPLEQDEGAVRWFSRAQIDVLSHDKMIIPSDYAMIEKFAETAPTPSRGQAASIPHVEAEMQATIDGNEKQAQLLRFEQI